MRKKKFLFFFNYLKTETKTNSEKITQTYHHIADVVSFFWKYEFFCKVMRVESRSSIDGVERNFH